MPPAPLRPLIIPLTASPLAPLTAPRRALPLVTVAAMVAAVVAAMVAVVGGTEDNEEDTAGIATHWEQELAPGHERKATSSESGSAFGWISSLVDGPIANWNPYPKDRAWGAYLRD